MNLRDQPLHAANILQRVRHQVRDLRAREVGAD